MASTNASTFTDFERGNAQLTAGLVASAHGLSSRTMTDAVCHSGSATPTHLADGSDDVLLLAGTKAVNNLAARAQLLDPALLVQCQDRSLGFPITWLANCLVGQANWLVRGLVVNQPYQDCRLKAVGTA